MTPLEAYVPGSAPFLDQVKSRVARAFAASRVPAARKWDSAAG